MKGASETKKSLVIAEARRDPFLTVDEIARRVGTTPRYVRTTLSEARLSLAQLRKAYARRIDALADGGEERRTSTFAPFERLQALGGDVRSGEIAVRRERDPEAALHCGVAFDTTLLIASRWIRVDGEPLVYNELCTVHPLALRTDASDLLQPLAKVLGLAGDGGQAAAHWLEAARADRAGAFEGRQPTGKPLLVIRELWADGGRPVGLESYWLDGERLRLEVDPGGSLQFARPADDFENRAVGQSGSDAG